MSQRPLGVTILAIWLIVGTILSIILYYFAAFRNENLFLAASLSVILNAIGLITAYGLLKGLSWAWTSAILLVIFGLVLSFINIISSWNIVIYFIGFRSSIFLIDLMILYYLTRPHVKAYFEKT
jgi:hypothetical protein